MEQGLFMTNRELREETDSTWATKSDSETVVMYNLDKLNDDCPEWLRRDAWNRGQILESIDSLIESLVSRVDRDRLRSDFGSLSSGPHIRRPNNLGQFHTVAHFMDVHPIKEVNTVPEAVPIWSTVRYILDNG